MRLHHFAAPVALLAALLAVLPAAAQPSLDEIDKRLREELPAPPGGDAPPRDSGFLGLFADDAETPGKGVEVISVHPGGPAEAAGIKRGDLIVAIDGKPIARIDDMATAVGAAVVGKRLRIEVDRAGKRSAHVLTVARRPAEAPKLTEDDLPLEAPSRPVPLVEPPLKPGVPRVPTGLGERASLGVRLLPVTEEAARRYGLTVRRGAVIEAIREGSAADKFTLPLGGVIVSFDGRPIDSPDDLVAALRAARPGDEVEIGYYQKDKLFRKTVRLAPATPAAPTDLPLPGALTDPDLGPRVVPGVPGLVDRPAVKKIEGLLDRLLPAAPDPALREPALPRADDRREVTELRTEVELLKAEVTRLTRKLAELEARLGEK
jgi:S1-C subfamily serine protease